jgi:hypothetical protein
VKVLFDNNVPAPLRYRLKRHEVHTAREMDWHELKNGDLLQQAEASGFDLMVTGDKNLSYQQNLESRQIAILVLHTINWKVLRQNPAPVVEAVNRAKLESFEQLEG